MESIFVFFMMVVSSIWRAFIITKFWIWFVVPVFGLPVLTIPVALGLTLLTFLFVPAASMTLDIKDNGKPVSPMVMQIAWQFLYLLLLVEGWAIHKFFV